MKLQHSLTDAQAAALMALEPWALRYGAAALEKAVDSLIASEQQRRGAPDPVTGAAMKYALTQGNFLNPEFDPSLHHQEWRIGAVLVDVKAMINQNERLGFARGDQLLAAVVNALQTALPAKVVRIHGDAFAAILGPISGRELEEKDAEIVSSALGAALAPFGAADQPVRFDLGMLAMTFIAPAHVQVLGPLVWSECERALLLAKSGRASGLQRRTIDLNASVPGEPTLGS